MPVQGVETFVVPYQAAQPGHVIWLNGRLLRLVDVDGGPLDAVLDEVGVLQNEAWRIDYGQAASLQRTQLAKARTFSAGDASWECVWSHHSNELTGHGFIAGGDAVAESSHSGSNLDGWLGVLAQPPKFPLVERVQGTAH